mmetsp:Transcript_22886/g.73695  ORF Transcript_22886/g.73695 Transcript_22886/m.73695 type:complete len:158 (-) Transcript_22886:132-605(-)
MSEKKDDLDVPPPSVDWDSWSSIQELLTVSHVSARKRDAESEVRLVVCCFAHSWSPASMHTAVLVDTIRATGKCPFARLFLVDATREREACAELGIAATPALVLFWDGEPLQVRRPGWDSDTKFVGSASERDLVNMVQYAREAGVRGETVIHIDTAT